MAVSVFDYEDVFGEPVVRVSVPSEADFELYETIGKLVKVQNKGAKLQCAMRRAIFLLEEALDADE